MELLLVGLGVVLLCLVPGFRWVSARMSADTRATPGRVRAPIQTQDEPPVLHQNADGSTYRANHGRTAPGTGWDPYAVDQSRSSRARAARQRANARRRQPVVPDYYALLGLKPDASVFEIERAYRRHAAVVHPDRFFDNPRLRLQAEAKLRQLNEAASVLRDPERRMKYDSEWGVH